MQLRTKSSQNWLVGCSEQCTTKNTKNRTRINAQSMPERFVDLSLYIYIHITHHAKMMLEHRNCVENCIIAVKRQATKKGLPNATLRKGHSTKLVAECISLELQFACWCVRAEDLKPGTCSRHVPDPAQRLRGRRLVASHQLEQPLERRCTPIQSRLALHAMVAKPSDQEVLHKVSAGTHHLVHKGLVGQDPFSHCARKRTQ